MFISTNIQIPAVCGTCKMLVMQCRDLLFDNVGRPLTWRRRLRSSCCPKCPFRQQKLRSRQPLVESFRCNLCLFQLCDCSLTCASNVHFNKHLNPCCLWHLQDVGHAVSGSPLRQCRKTTNLATATAELLLSKVPLSTAKAPQSTALGGIVSLQSLFVSTM